MQVREHTQSTLRQYALADTAVALGWAARDVEVIDRDLGLSGTSAAHRAGFRELMSRVCLGEIGAVLGLEISRLAPRRKLMITCDGAGPATPWSPSWTGSPPGTATR